MRKIEKDIEKEENKKELEKESIVFPYDDYSVQSVIFIGILHTCLTCNLQ